MNLAFSGFAPDQCTIKLLRSLHGDQREDLLVDHLKLLSSELSWEAVALRVGSDEILIRQAITILDSTRELNGAIVHYTCEQLLIILQRLVEGGSAWERLPHEDKAGVN
ncbi:hypothetical protein N9L26_00465 [Candidatus Pacebacteria bacterium]|nr:hypothetical protein [Candidatus Paceibacterota bacterium]